MRLLGIGVFGLLMACGEEAEKTEDLSMYCGESETNNLIADDGDCDGILTADDCDDNDDTSTTIAEDADCDGALTDDDCDDSDAESAIRSEDGDCDGVLTADDCNDLDPSSTIVADDGDCDGVLTADDCDDSDASDAALSGDCDADGYGQSVDCDDNDASSTIMTEDGDCDGVLTDDDCDDADAGSFTRADDGDCDGILTADDCDDSDDTSTTIAEDVDCDGILTADDCDDLDPTSTIVADDVDCDGVLAVDDCDDNDASSTTVAVDMDCDGALDINECDAGAGVDTDTDGDCDDDGILGINDCDDNDVTLLASALDQDCDGVQTTYDCDDNDATDAGLSGDCDQDGVPALLDCDDTDGNLLAVATDADCDGALDVNECDAGAGVDTDTDGDCDDDGVLAGDDCDDNDATLLAIVDDADCDGVLDATCGGFLESVQDTALCYTDGDGDDFGSMLTSAGGLSPECYFIEISGETSSYSSIDSIVGYEDGVWEFYIDHDNYDSTPDFVAEGLSTTYCPSPTASLVELEFVDGSGFADYSVYYDDGMSTQLITTGSDSNGSHSILSESWPTVNTMPVYGTDCDDTDPNTHPGAAELDSTTACLTDADGDGYGLEVIQACYELTLSDSNYLGWDGNSISVLEDGLVTETFTISTSETTVTHEYCADSATQQVDFVFNEASPHNYGWFGGTGLSVSYVTDSGTVLAGSGSGVTSSAYTLLFDGNSFGSGDVFLSNTAPFAYGLSNGGTDCDDSDATLGSNLMDADCDGVLTTLDCDDADPYTYPGAAYNELDVTGDNVTDCTRDVDGDGYASSLPEHCLTFTMSAYDIDASDGHGIAVLVDGFFEELIAFDENVSEETVCVSGTELDFVVMPYGNDLGNTFAGVSGSIEDAAGTISETFSASINSVASLTFDGTTYAAGDTFYSVTPVLPYELGSDCDDQSAVTHPGAGYNETGTLANECLTDTDGDGYGAEDLIACYEIQMQNTSSILSAWPIGVSIEVLVDTGLGTYNQSTFRMNSIDGASKTEMICLPEWTDILFRYQQNHSVGVNLSNVYAEIVGTTGTTEATLDGTHNGSTFFQTMRVYDSNGSFSIINPGSTILWSDSYPAATNLGGTDSNDNSAGVH